MAEIRAGKDSLAFEVLRQEVDELMREPTGVGLERGVAGALDDEVDEVGQRLVREAGERGPALRQLPLSCDEVQRELTDSDGDAS